MNRAAQWETLLRCKLAAIRDEAMELQATLEFSVRDDVTKDAVWQFASRVVAQSEEIMRNQHGELSQFRGDQEST
jgi:hypothetical protein